MERRLWEIVDNLTPTEYKTATQIGKSIGNSEKTVRTRIKQINEELDGHGAQVISKPRYGYYLDISDEALWEAFQRTRNEENDTIPVDTDERVDYILDLFLNKQEYVKLEDLSEFLFVSVKTLSNEIKKVEYILSHFDLELEKKPHYGMKVIGDEFNKRKCILQHFYLTWKPFWKMRAEEEHHTVEIAEQLIKIMSKYQLRFSEMAFQSTVYFIYLSITRMKNGIYITKMPEKHEEKIEILAARDIYQGLPIPKHVMVNDSEIYYTGIYIAGKRFMGREEEERDNFLITEEVDQLVMRILNKVYETYHVELRNNLNLRVMLSQHMVPLQIRMKYKIPVEKMELDDIIHKYVFAYTIAQLAASIISKEYGAEISDNETACLAVYFALALEEKKTDEKVRKNILLVCISGKASSQMLMYRFRQEFGEYIKSLDICGMYDLDQYDLKNIDLVFTTVPIYKKVPVPIMEIHDFLDTKDIVAIRNMLEVGDFQFLSNFYQPKYFFTDIEAMTKEEAIAEICSRIRETTDLPDNFEESVLKREFMGPTDFGNQVAIPHPCELMTDENVIAVGILKHDILWSTKKVRLVVLTSLAKEKTQDTQKFYDVTSKFLMNQKAVKKLLEKPEFDVFWELLCQVEERK